MSSLPYPRNALPIVQARAQGMKPAGPVIVILTPQYQVLRDDANVFAEAGKQYRWDWVRGLLSVVVVIDAGTKLGSLLTEIEAASPQQIDVVDVQRQRAWMVCFASPELRTVKWPSHLVADWLGNGKVLLQTQAIVAAGNQRIEQEKARWR